jgi:hypothetical protein
MLELDYAIISELIQKALVRDQLQDLYSLWQPDDYDDQKGTASLRRELLTFARTQARIGELLTKISENSSRRYQQYAPRLVKVSEQGDGASSSPELCAKIEELAHLLGPCLVQFTLLDLQSLFNHSCPALRKVMPSTPCPAEFLVACVNLALESPLSKDTASVLHPLLAFVRALATKVRADNQGDLQTWVDKAVAVLFPAAENPQAAAQQRALLRQPVGSSAPPPASCRLIIDVFGGDEKNLDLKVYLRGTPRDECQWAGNFTRAKLPALLEECRNTIAGFGISDEAVWVECFLPARLLNLDVDQWLAETVQDLDLAKPIGFYHHVCIRIRERCKPKQGSTDVIYYNRWLRRCTQESKLPSDLCAVADCCRWSKLVCIAAWLARSTSNWSTLDAQLLKSPGLFCLLFRQPPTSAELTLNHKNAVTLLVRAGIPRALWIRIPPEGDLTRVHKELEDLLDQQKLGELPDRILKLRGDAQQRPNKAEWHLGDHVTFLWDDAARPHPLTETTSPGPAGALPMASDTLSFPPASSPRG